MVEAIVYEGEQFLTKHEVKNIAMTVIDLGYTQAVSVEITLGRQLLTAQCCHECLCPHSCPHYHQLPHKLLQGFLFVTAQLQPKTKLV